MRGIWTALVTPFNEKNELDLEAFRRIIRDQKDAGVAGVIPCGTTGESPTLSQDEKKTLIKTALEELKGSQVKVYAGTGSNDTASTVAFSKWASDQGVDGILVVTPYYNKPTQAGLKAHFKAVADAVSCDIMLYNVPGRTAVSLSADTIAELAEHPRITSVKEATANPAFTSEIQNALAKAGRKLMIFSGDDATFLPLLSVGADGVVSVSSNLFPRGMVAIFNAFGSGNVEEASRLQQRYFPLFRDLFVEANPIPIKWAMAEMGWCRNQLRLPLLPLSESQVPFLKKALELCQISKGSKA